MSDIPYAPPPAPPADDGTITPDLVLHGPCGPPRADPLLEMGRLYAMSRLSLDGMPLRLPKMPADGAPAPGAKRRPRPPHVPAPPPHLDPDRTEEEREAAYRVLFNAWRAERAYRADFPDDYPDQVEQMLAWND